MRGPQQPDPEETYRYEFFRLEDLEFANAFYLDGIRIWHLTMHAQKVA